MFILIPDVMEAAMKRDLDKLRDSLPESEHALFEQERHLIRDQIVQHYGEYGTYPVIDGIEPTKGLTNETH